MRSATLVLLLVLAAAACVDRPGGPTVEGRTFLGTTVTDGGAARPLVPGTAVRIDFRDGRIVANAGCNTMGGTYRLDGGVLVVAAAGVTEMGCDPARHAQDEWLFALLGGGPALRLTGDELVVEADSTILALVDREVADPDRPLAGPLWTVDSIIAGDAVSSVPAGAQASLQFGADGSVAIDTGCNTGSGRAEAAGSTIRFADVALTKRGCDGAAGQLEAAVLGILTAAAVDVRVDASSLTLTTADGGLVLTAH